ncbi:hypothetical protein [Variovorax sp. YR566]|uniref:hypothetical protein n=1 Tax=Variovorax sp. YR566 TaxID=3450237 RepID=UPI003F80CAAE
MISKGYERKLFDRRAPERHAYIYGLNKNGGRTQTLVLGKEHEYASDVKRAAQVAYAIARSERAVFWLEKERSGTCQVIRASHDGKHLLQALQLPFDDIQATLPQHHMNPLYELLQRSREKHILDAMALSFWNAHTDDAAHVLLDSLEAVVRDIREGWASGGVRKALDTARRRSDKRWKSVKKAEEESFQDCADLLTIRLDLHFHSSSDGYPYAPAVSEDEAYGYIVKFERYLRERHPLVRYMRNMEYGTESGFHFHMLVFLNGSLAQDGVGIAKTMGEHWEWVITEGKGRYFNCNAHKYVKPVLGRIHYSNLVARQALLESAASYLAKTDIWMRYDALGKSFVISRRYKQPYPGGAKRKLWPEAEGGAASA